MEHKDTKAQRFNKNRWKTSICLNVNLKYYGVESPSGEKSGKYNWKTNKCNWKWSNIILYELPY